jgi:hypothetical protein
MPWWSAAASGKPRGNGKRKGAGTAILRFVLEFTCRQFKPHNSGSLSCCFLLSALKRNGGTHGVPIPLPSCSHRPSIGLRFSSVCKLTSTRTTTGQPKRLSAQFCVFRRERKLNGQVSGSSPSVKEGTRSSDQGTSSYRRSSCSLRQRHIRREKEPEACPSQLGHGLRLPKERVGQGSEKTQVLRIRQFPCGESENSRQLHERRSPPRKKRWARVKAGKKTA